MILLDTNVLIYAFDPGSPFHRWARKMIVDAVAGDGAAINAVSLAELCVGDADPPTVADRVRSWGVEILDVPAAAAEVCATAYREYRNRRISQSDIPAPNMPLPDFFIGAHAKIMRTGLATTDRNRFHTYFPSVLLKIPQKTDA
jgi:predicted nucleic acid-binding protein